MNQCLSDAKSLVVGVSTESDVIINGPCVTSKLIGSNHCEFRKEIAAEYEAIRFNYLSRKSAKEYLSIEKARANKLQSNWQNLSIKKPNQLGVQTFEDIDISVLRNYIDWTPFFFTWEMRKKYPAILKDGNFGKQAQQLFTDANKMLDDIIKNRWLKAKAVLGIWQANSVGDDVHLYINSDDFRYLVFKNHFIIFKCFKLKGISARIFNKHC